MMRSVHEITNKKGAKSLKPLPSYDDLLKAQTEKAKEPDGEGAAQRTNEFTERFERANQIGKYARETHHGADRRDDPVQDPG